MIEQELFENIPTGMGVFDVTGDNIEMKFINDGYYNMIRSSRADRIKYTGKKTILAIHSEDLTGLLKEAAASIKENRMFQYRFRVLSGTGAYMWISIRANHKKISEKTERFFAVYYDVDTYVSERRRLESILENIPGGAALFSDHGGRIHLDYTNDGFYELHHGSKEFWKTQSDNPVDWLVDADRHVFEEEFALVSSGKKTKGNVAYRVTGEDGKLHWVNNQFRRAYVTDGIPYYYSSFTGLDKLKKFEQEKYTQLYDRVSATLSEAVSSTRLDLSRNTYVNGYSADPAVERRLVRETAAEHFAAAIESVADEKIRTRLSSLFTVENLLSLFRKGTTQISETYPVLTSRGMIIWVNTTVYLLKNPETDDIEALTYAKDVTKLTQDDAILKYLAEDGCDFVGIIDVNTKTFSLHEGDWKREGVFESGVTDYDECRKKLSDEYITADERQKFYDETDLEKIAAYLTDHPQYTTVYSLNTKHGDCLKKQLRFAMLGGPAHEMLIIQSDITEVSKEQQRQISRLHDALIEAENANTAKTEFVSRISHDIRTPISIITNMTQFARDDVGNREKLLSDLRKIEAANEFLLSLINDVLDISKIDSGKIEFHPEPYLYDEYISNIQNMFEPLCAQKHITFVIEKDPSVKFISVDKTRLNQITLNLVSNAVKYTNSGGTVTFSCTGKELADDTVRCSIMVKDTGIGMSESFQKKMFEPFSQEYDNPGRDKTVMGTGLGLSIVKKFVDMTGGTISVRSVLGKGTEIHVDFIAVKVVERSEIVAAEAAQPGEKFALLSGKVLLAEDNILNTEIAERILESMGLSADHAENGSKAFELFTSAEPGTYRAILMDIQMPVMNGYEAAEKIRSFNRADAKTVPIIAMTADAFSAALERSYEVGMNDYVTKPINPVLLRRALAKYCSSTSL